MKQDIARRITIGGALAILVVSVSLVIPIIDAASARNADSELDQSQGLATITPLAPSFALNETPVFNINTGTNGYYSVELALAKHLFDESFGNRRPTLVHLHQNFYTSGIENSFGGQAYFTVSNDVWQNLRGARVFYRVITSSDPEGSDIRYSTSDAEWEEAPFVGRTGEAWYGLPLNDQATIGQINIVIDGELNTRALSSDVGPRDVAGGTKFHPGLDIPVVLGTPVYSIADGVVVTLLAPQTHRIDIDHGSYRTGYVHLDNALVSLGEEVAAGQLIGYSGDWHFGIPGGTPDHLHFDAGRDTNGQIYHNSLDYVPYTDNHQISNDESTYLADQHTHDKAIDVVKAAGDQHLALVAFGLTTSFDKDLNYVSVQVDGSSASGQSFVLDYDQVTDQNTDSGVITLSSGRTFRVRPLTDDIYGDTALGYAFYVKPESTNVDLVAKDYFFFPWNTAVYADAEDAGVHTISVAVRDVEGERVVRSLEIGPEIEMGVPNFNSTSIEYPLSITNHDDREGTIDLEIRGLPGGWNAVFSDPAPRLAAGGTTQVTLRLEAPVELSEDPLEANDTRVVAVFARIPDLMDSIDVCPATGAELQKTNLVMNSASNDFCGFTPQVEIISPENNATVIVETTEFVEVKSVLGATSVELYVEDDSMPIESTDGVDTWTFKWDVPPAVGVTYELQAYAIVDGVDYESTIVYVTSQAVDLSNQVVFEEPSGSYVNLDELTTVVVKAPSETVSVDLHFSPSDGHATVAMVKDVNSGKWEYQWTPLTEGPYVLRAAAFDSNNTMLDDETIQITARLAGDLTIGVPSTLNVGETISIKVSASGAANVTLTASGAYLELTSQQGSDWTFTWTPQVFGEYELEARAVYPFGDPKTETTTVTVLDESQNIIKVDITSPKPGATLNARRANTISLESPGPIRKFELLITDEHGAKLILSNDIEEPCTAPCSTKSGFRWIPPNAGTFTLQAFAWDPNGYKGWTTPFSITTVEVDHTIPINEYAFLRKIPDLKNLYQGGWYIPPTLYDTKIPSTEYVCAIVGYQSRGGDIGEKTHGTRIIQAYLRTWASKPDGNWLIMADFGTWNGDRNFIETWDITLLCISTEIAARGDPEDGQPIFVKALPRMGDNVDQSIGYSSEKYVCGIAGFDSHAGDINEKGTGDIIQTYLYRKDGEWFVRADFRTHEGKNENWAIHVLCIDKKMASSDGPLPDKPFFLREYFNLGDNLGPKNEFDTGIPVNDFVCGVVGFAARNGDIDEHNKSSDANLFSAVMYEEGLTWHIRADFRTHRNDETWDVNILCLLKEGGEPYPWDESVEEEKSSTCLGEPYLCQVLRDEAIAVTGPVYVIGGGVSGMPTHQGLRCPGEEYIEVYINDRDPGTDKPRWSAPDLCLRDGDSININSSTIYDFRGVSVAGASPLPFKLRSALGPPELNRVYPNLFPVPYGPGIALEWEPTLHPQAVDYEIQFSEDSGSTWQVYSRTRDVSFGGWMNHHSNFKCGFGFERCLKRSQKYSYRLRVLDKDQNPITGWSNILTTTSFEWPVHLELADPFPAGPYPYTEEVTLTVENTYGHGLDLEWTLIHYSGASYTVVSGCQSGSYTNPNVNTCVIRIRNDALAFEWDDSAKMAKLAPETSVDVRVRGIDDFGFVASDGLSLRFEQSCPGDSCEPVEKDPNSPEGPDELW
jgi:murein DD-endopeptidase MepM/ murein hydrolase activator NlpD